MKPICKNPPHSPSSGISRQGPVFRNLAIPKDAVNIEEKNVSVNKSSFPPTMIDPSIENKVNNIWTWGRASRNGSEKINLIVYQLQIKDIKTSYPMTLDPYQILFSPYAKNQSDTKGLGSESELFGIGSKTEPKPKVKWATYATM